MDSPGSINRSVPSTGVDSTVQLHEDQQTSSESVKALLGNTPREIKLADKNQTTKLASQMTADEAEITDTKEKVPKKNIKQRSITKAYAWGKEKAGALNSLRKEWQKAPVQNTKVLGGMVGHASAAKLKSAGHTLKKGYTTTKSGAKKWNADKKEVTLSVAKALYKGTKNQTIKKAKALKNYVITKKNVTASKLGSLKARLHKTHSYDLVKAKKSLNKRKCTQAVELKKSTPPPRPPLPDILKKTGSST